MTLPVPPCVSWPGVPEVPARPQEATRTCGFGLRPCERPRRALLSDTVLSDTALAGGGAERGAQAGGCGSVSICVG